MKLTLNRDAKNFLIHFSLTDVTAEGKIQPMMCFSGVDNMQIIMEKEVNFSIRDMLDLAENNDVKDLMKLTQNKFFTLCPKCQEQFKRKIEFFKKMTLNINGGIIEINLSTYLDKMPLDLISSTNLMVRQWISMNVKDVKDELMAQSDELKTKIDYSKINESLADPRNIHLY